MKENIWIIYVLAALFITGVVHFALFKVVKHLTGKAFSKETLFSRALFNSLNMPLGFLTWLLGLSTAGTIFLSFNKNQFLFNNLILIKKNWNSFNIKLVFNPLYFKF